MANNYGADRFNAMRKKRTRKGSPVRATTYNRTSSHRTSPAATRARASHVRSGGPSVKTASTRAARAGGTGGFTSSPERMQSVWANTLNQLTNDYTESMNKQAAVDRTIQQGIEQEETGLLSHIPGHTYLEKAMGGLMASPVGAVLYNAGRAPNAVFQAMEDMARNDRNASQDRGFWEEGGHIWNTLAGGAARGWSYEGDPGAPPAPGPDSSGFGQVYEALKENPTSLVHEPLTGFEEAHPRLEQAGAIALGVAGEAYLDPTDFFMPAVPAILRGSGRALTREALQQTTDIAIREAFQNALNSNPATLGRSPFDPDMINARAQEAVSDALNESLRQVSGGGAPHARTIGGSAFPSLVSQRWGESVLESISGKADEVIQGFWNGSAATHTAASIDAARAAFPDFDDVWQGLTTDLMAKYPISGTTDEVLAILKGAKNLNPNSTIGKIIDSHWTTVRNRNYVQLEPHIQALYKAVENPTTRTLGLRIGKGSGSRVVSVPAVGRAFGWAGSQLGKLPGVQGLGRNLYEKAFPALFAGKISRASAYGVRGFDNFMRELEKVAKGFTPDEAKELFKAMGDATFTFGEKEWTTPLLG